MAININNLSSNTQVKQNQQADVNKHAAAQKTLGSEQTKHVSQDSVSLTPQAKQLSDLQKKANDAPVIDQKKIDQLKKAISAGEYKINPEKLAASIANFEFKLV